MPSLIRAELLKIRSARANLLLALAAVLTAGLPLLAFIAPGTPVESFELAGTLPGVSIGGVELSAFLVMLLAVIGVAGEFHHRTAVSTFLVAPARWKVVAAKVAAYTIVGALLALAAALLALAVVPPVARAADVAITARFGDVVRALAATAGMGAAFAAMGVGIGGLIRNQTAAALVAVGWFFVAEGILPALVGEAATDVLPGSAAAALAGLSDAGWVLGAAALAVWAAGLGAAAARAVAWRDVA